MTCDSSIQRENSARLNREVHADQTEWTDARIHGIMWTENMCHSNNRWHTMIVYECSLPKHVFTHHTVCMYGHTKGRGANPARGQLNQENKYFPVPVRA